MPKDILGYKNRPIVSCMFLLIDFSFFLFPFQSDTNIYIKPLKFDISILFNSIPTASQ